ncbi:hypothetical protein F5Y03DRAFT_397397 [Xylaria venustula]|nr:hypothetical protein F5Y03DRAFT_397397 [Xylaria venustula]
MANPGWSVDIGLAERGLDDALANLIRRDGFFRAILVHSHGTLRNDRCANKCGHRNGSSLSLQCMLHPRRPVRRRLLRVYLPVSRHPLRPPLEQFLSPVRLVLGQELKFVFGRR